MAAEVPAQAASASEASGAGVGELVVTAQRRSESIQKTPVAVTAFGQDAVKTQSISTFRDLSGRVPGLLAPRRSTAYTTQTYAIRGVGEIDTYPFQRVTGLSPGDYRRRFGAGPAIRPD